MSNEKKIRPIDRQLEIIESMIDGLPLVVDAQEDFAATISTPIDSVKLKMFMLEQMISGKLRKGIVKIIGKLTVSYVIFKTKNGS